LLVENVMVVALVGSIKIVPVHSFPTVFVVLPTQPDVLAAHAGVIWAVTTSPEIEDV
jgi:hypothetical protein